MKIALCQFNPVVGAMAQNAKRILEFSRRAYDQKMELIIFPELALCGYPPKDLVFLQSFRASCQQALAYLAEESALPIIVGAPTPERYNAAYYCSEGQFKIVATKRLLPNYQVFDEQRYFKISPIPRSPFFLKGEKLGVCICEDA